ncbi:helix-turn-helix domain-containing protein [Streptomyces bauhiniae]|uniref:helix-turn-helix domain-containing protein n=1 Tax=Streptomyces bauhiniae TaxID=2340725 RepID=UPI0036584436
MSAWNTESAAEDGGTVSTQDDVEGFAALLRLLKDRTDRSYGSLARRVSMNTSTLHRYCAGKAVPQDFAPVERLAAFCGATPEERLELHRLWLSAAARQQARTAGPAAVAGPAPDADGSPAEVSGPAEQGVAPEEIRTPEKPALSSAPRPWPHRRRALVATTAACALLATLGIVSALSDHRRPQAHASRSADPRTITPGGNTEPPATPSPARSRSSRSPGHRQKAAVPSGKGTGTGTHPAPAAKPAVGPPLAWSVDSQVWEGGCGHDYVIDKPPAQVPPPPVEQDAAAWTVTQGAVHGRRTLVQISVQGRSSTAVVLEALRVRVVSRGAPVAGTVYAMDQGCGGDLEPRRFTVDLDANRPIARPKDGADVGRTLPALHFPYRVSAEDPEVLLIEATTRVHDARWYLELDWSCQGRTGTVRIDSRGGPFRTTGIDGMPRYWYGTNDAGERAWVRTTTEE